MKVAPPRFSHISHNHTTSLTGHHSTLAGQKVESVVEDHTEGPGVIKQPPPRPRQPLSGATHRSYDYQKSSTGQTPVGGRLKIFAHQWTQITTDKLVLSIIQKGYAPKLTHSNIPPNLNKKTQLPKNPQKRRALLEEIESLLTKRAIKRVYTKRHLVISPVFLTPKRKGGFRMVLNVKKLNRYVANSTFKMENLRNILPLIKVNDWAASIDLVDAYLHVPIARFAQHLLGFAVGNKMYQYRALPFGLKTAPRIFTRIVQTIAAHLRLKGIRIFVYLDDWLVVADMLRQHVKVTLNLVTKLGFLINHEKSHLEPTQCPEFLGAELDLKVCLARPLPHRIDKVLQVGGNLLSKTQAQAMHWLQFLGLLASLIDTVSECRRRMRQIQIAFLSQYRPQRDPMTKIIIRTRTMTRAVRWWLNPNILQKGKPFTPPAPSMTIFTDASNTGWGAVLKSNQIQGSWGEKEKGRHINILEMQAVQNTLHTFKNQVRKETVLVKSDNLTVESYLNKQGGTRSKRLTVCNLTLEILNWCDSMETRVVASHIPGKDNYVADFLSRGSYLPSEWQLNPRTARQIFNKIGHPQVDLFASTLNRQLPVYCTKHKDPAALTTDAFTMTWSNFLGYAFPPFVLIPRVLQKVQTDKANLLLIAPWWPKRPWFPTLVDLLILPPIILPDQKDLLQQPGTRTYHPNVANLKLTLWPISGKSQLRQAYREGLQSCLLHSSDHQRGLHMTLDCSTTLNGAAVTRLIQPQHL